MELPASPGWLAMAGLACLALAAVCLVGFLITTLHTLTHPETPVTEQPDTQTGARPARGDQFEAWLKTQRDSHPRPSHAWFMVDCVLDTYRLHADTGTPLSEHVCEARTVGDCDCMEADAPAVEAKGGEQ